MNLDEVWNYMSPELRKIVASAEDERMDTDHMLSLIAGSKLDDRAIPIVEQIVDQVGLERVQRTEIGNPTCPEEYELSPDVRETFNFFRIHSIHDLSIAHFVLKLLQIGSGSTIRELEKSGDLYHYRQDLMRILES